MTEPSAAELELLLGRLSLEEKVRLLTGRDSWSLHPLPRIGLHPIVMSDGPVGVRGSSWDERSPSVNFPSPTTLAASWDRDVVRAVGEAIGAEAQRKGVHVVLAPTINLHRSPYGGRHFEAFSEDPLLTAELAGEYVRGIQSLGVGATVKHYVANDSETDRFTVDVRVGDQALRELYLLAFEGPVRDAGAWLVMSAYNSINGATASENGLLTTPLNDEWGFDGVVVSDWTAVRSLESARHPQDLAMPGPGGAWGDALVRAVRSGEIDEAAIDRKVVRILRLAARVGALRNGAARVAVAAPGDDPRDIARRAAAAGTVLLKNESVLLESETVLPLEDPSTIALIGEGAVDARTQGGGSATVIPADVVSPALGLTARWPEADVAWARGAVVQTRPSDLPEGSFTTEDGEEGMTVRYLDEQGNLLRSEDRRVSGIVSFDGESLASRSATIEMAFRYAAPEGDAVRLAICGLSDYEVWCGASRLAAGSIRTAPGDDPATAVLTPPFDVVDLPRLGDELPLLVRFRPAEGGIPDALALRVGIPAVSVDPDTLIADAATLAASRDVAIVVVSTSPEVESEGFDRQSLRLPGRQDDLVRAVARANPRTIVIVNAGAPVILPWRDEVAAILTVWFPGQEFGDALADVLSGDVEPGGRLPVSWPGAEEDVPVSVVTPTDGLLEYVEGIHIGYRAWRRAGTRPAYAFGAGQGYTTFEVRELRTTPEIGRGGEALADVSVVNTGERDGKAVVQIYAERLDATCVERPALWLVGFASVTVAAGEERHVRIGLPWRRFAHWTADGWTLEPGTFRLTAALASDRPGSTATIRAR